MSEPCVAQLMSAGPTTIAAEAPMSAADRLLREHNIGGLPVVDRSGGLVGVVSRTDVLRVSADERNPAWTGGRVSGAMGSPAITIGPEASLAEAAAVMERGGVHRLVVVDESGAVVGIFSTTDLVRAVAGRVSLGPAG